MGNISHMTREDIIAVYQQGPEAVVTRVTTLLERIERGEARVKTLEDRLSQDSHNSHKPPSSDPGAHATRSLRQPSGKKPGGQPGHKGHTLRLVEQPDTLVTHPPACCCRCAASLREAEVVDIRRRQVWEGPRCGSSSPSLRGWSNAAASVVKGPARTARRRCPPPGSMVRA